MAGVDEKLEIKKLMEPLFKTMVKFEAMLQGMQESATQLLKINTDYEKIIISEAVSPLLEHFFGPSYTEVLPSKEELICGLATVLKQKQISVLNFQESMKVLRKNLDRQHLGKRIVKKAKPQGVLEKKHPLKILYVLGMFPSPRHGGGQRALEILLELSARANIDLCSVFDENHDRKTLEKLAPRLGEIYLAKGELRPQHVLDWLKRLNRKSRHYDIIQFEYINTVDLIKPLRPFGKASYFTLVESVSLHHMKWIEAYGYKLNAMTTAWRLFGLLEAASFESHALMYTDRAIALTPEDATFSKMHFGKMPIILPFGISREIYRELEMRSQEYRRSKKKYSAGFIGYFDHPPNFEGVEWYLKYVHPHVRRKIKNFSLVLVGGGSQVDRLVELCEDFPEIEVTGYVDDFASVLAQCEICIAPLISGAGMRGKLHQYAALKSAFVSTTLAAQGTTYRHGQSALICDDPKDFSQAMIHLLSDNTYRKSIANNAAEVVKRDFYGPHLIEKLEKIYEN